jgi:hypothetical protein
MQTAGGFEGSESKPAPPSDHIPLGAALCYSMVYFESVMAYFDQYRRRALVYFVPLAYRWPL